MGKSFLDKAKKILFNHLNKTYNQKLPCNYLSISGSEKCET